MVEAQRCEPMARFPRRKSDSSGGGVNTYYRRADIAAQTFFPRRPLKIGSARFHMPGNTDSC
jgi:hypothetical protein